MDAEEQFDCSYIAWLSHFAPWRLEVIREALGLTIEDWLQVLQPGVADGDVGDWKREGF